MVDLTDAVLWFDSAWRLLHLNAAGERMLGRCSQELVGTVVWDALPRLDGSPLGAASRRAMVERIPIPVDDCEPIFSADCQARVLPVTDGLAMIVFGGDPPNREPNAALVESGARGRLLDHATSDVSWDWDLQSDVIVCNESVRSTFGHPSHEIRADSSWWFDHVHPEDRDRILDGIAEVLDNGGETWSDEYRFRRRDGTYVVVRDRGYLLPDSAGCPRHMVGSMLDITEHENFQCFLDEQTRLTRTIIDNLPELAWTARADGHIDFYNRRWYEYTGTTLAEMEGWGWEAVHHPDTHPKVVERWKRSIATGEPFEMEFPLRGADGVYRWFLTRIRPLHDADGRIVRWFGTNTDIDEQRKLREAVEAQSRLTKAITDNASGALFLMDERQHCTFMNPAAEKMTGFSASEVTSAGKPLHDIIHHRRPDGRPYPMCECPIDRAFPTRAREQGLDVFVHKDGHFYTVGFMASPMIVDGRVAGTVIEVQDLTAAESREAWLSAVIEGSPVGLAVLDRDLRYVRINSALARLHDLPIEAHLGRTLEEVLSGLPRELLARYRDVVDSGQPVVDLEIEIPEFVRNASSDVATARPHHAQLSIYPIVVRGFVQGVVGMVQEITSRKREEQRKALLARASQVLAASLDLEITLKEISQVFVPDIADWANVYLRRDDGSFELAAVAHADSSKETVIRALFEELPPNLRGGAFDEGELHERHYELLDVLDEGASITDARGSDEWLARVRETGTVSILLVPMISRGRTIGIVSLGARAPDQRFHSDRISLVEEVARRAASALENARLFELAKSERRRADEANRAKDAFLAVVSHELRTPLNAILGWARMLLGDMLSPERMRKATEVIERNATAQAELIEDLLDISRIISGKLKLELETFEISRVVQAAVEVVAPAADGKGVTIETVVPASGGSVVGDPNRLQQAIWNLLTNAVKFTPKGGRVFVRLERAPSAWVVTVEDTGEGIDRDFLGHVFERFQQAEMSSRRRHGGLGLGLSIVRHIAELHGGHVDAASGGRGCGSTFRMTIPISPLPRPSTATVRRAQPSASAAAVESTACASIRGLYLLVVDDEKDARELLASILEACGAEVVTAASAREALASFESRRPDVIISDIGMPGEDGYDLIERIRGRSPADGGRTPAIALTAYARTEDHTKALLAGFSAHVTKPAKPGHLVMMVASVAGRLPTS